MLFIDGGQKMVMTKTLLLVVDLHLINKGRDLLQQELFKRIKKI